MPSLSIVVATITIKLYLITIIYCVRYIILNTRNLHGWRRAYAADADTICRNASRLIPLSFGIRYRLALASSSLLATSRDNRTRLGATVQSIAPTTARHCRFDGRPTDAPTHQHFGAVWTRPRCACSVACSFARTNCRSAQNCVITIKIIH